MHSSRRLAIALLVVAVASACGGSSGTSSASSNAGATPSVSTGGNSKLDPAVAMPAGFPADVPVYPGARLTAADSFASTGQTTWGMEWETVDGVDKVHTYFADKLSQGDWAIQFSGATGQSFAAVFTRKSNSKSTGLLGADVSSGVTKISLSLVNS